MDGFEPKTPFEGYVKAKLESVAEDIADLTGRHRILSDRVRQVEIKGGIWGAVSGAISGTLAHFGLKLW